MIFCASKISNNGVKLDVPKDLKPQITDIAKKGCTRINLLLRRI